ncbi:porin family protein [Bizionia myxarmorum]|uniref:Porin family protein n=1 Tax=Bizionia myxarmorum TaxID=291186 RepID=A0A5D0RGY5_9FLAO|nr:porin family protein [Bizionia myxarmorum]TYB79794.1 porin family protein [Bizionia myxarmorum]
MKKLFLVAALIGLSPIFAQENTEITPDNSWLKVGLTAGVPVGDASDASSFALGADIRGQYLFNPNVGVGIASGYTNYFGKDGVDDFGIVPLAGFFRYYFTPSGLFLGVDLGYGFLTNVDYYDTSTGKVESNDGGLYVNPQIGYHNRDWNIYAYYQNTFADNDLNVSNVGVGVTYNIRFN